MKKVLTSNEIAAILLSPKIKKIQNNRIYLTRQALNYINERAYELNKSNFFNYLELDRKLFTTSFFKKCINRSKSNYDKNHSEITFQKKFSNLSNNKYVEYVSATQIRYTKEFYLLVKKEIEFDLLENLLQKYGINKDYYTKVQLGQLKYRIVHYTEKKKKYVNNNVKDYKRFDKSKSILFEKRKNGYGFSDLTLKHIQILVDKYDYETTMFILGLNRDNMGLNQYHATISALKNKVKKQPLKKTYDIEKELQILNIINKGLRKLNSTYSVKLDTPILTHRRSLLALDIFNNNSNKLKLSTILKILKINKTSYYQHIKDMSFEERYRSSQNKEMMDFHMIKEIFDYGNYKKGAKQIYMQIKKEYGLIIGLNKIRRIMKTYGLKCTFRGPNYNKRALRKMLSDNVKENKLDRNFKQERAHKMICTDISYLKFGNGKRAYLSMFIDASTNKILSYRISNNFDSSLATIPLQSLFDKGIEFDNLALFHSDQGAHYTSFSYQAIIKNNNFIQSMSKRGICWDNAVIESRFGIIKGELNYSGCETLEELQEVFRNYFDYYNNKRPQWGLNKLTPTEYEGKLMTTSQNNVRIQINNKQSGIIEC